VYVQDRLREQAELVWKLIHEQGAHFYVCGDASSMAGAVRAYTRVCVCVCACVCVRVCSNMHVLSSYVNVPMCP